MNIRIMNVASGYFKLKQNGYDSQHIPFDTSKRHLESNLDHHLSAYGDAEVVIIKLDVAG